MRDCRTVQVVVAGLLLGICGAQGGLLGGPSEFDPSYLVPEVVESIYAATAETTGTGEYPVLDLAKQASRLFVMRRDPAAVEEEVPPIRACAFADGSSGVPKIGGGGEDMFGPSGMPTSLTPMTPAPLALGGPAWTNMVIVDEFDFGRLAGDGLHTVDTTGGAFGPTLGLYDLLLGTNSTNFLDPPHGNLVVFHILRLAAPTGTVTFQRIPISGPMGQAVWTIGMAGRTLMLIDVDYGDGDSVFSSLGLIARGAVVNLSWNIFECQIIDEYQRVSEVVASAGETIRTLLDYVRDVLDTVKSDAKFQDLCQQLMPQPPPAPAASPDERCASVLALAILFEMDRFATEKYFADMQRLFDPEEGPIATVFAAAGNQGLPFALPPASWQRVNAVAACFQAEPVASKAPFSNATLKLGGAEPDFEFTAPGAWFSVNFSGPKGEPLGYWGTSFASPNVAVVSSSGALAAAPKTDTGTFLGCEP